MYDEDALPSEARVKRFFGSLSQRRKAAQRDQDTAVIVAKAALRKTM